MPQQVRKSELAGKLVKVIDMVGSGYQRRAIFTAEDSDAKYSTAISDNYAGVSIPDAIATSLIDEARRSLVGKTRWYAERLVWLPRSDMLSETEKTRKYSRTRIGNIVAGTNPLYPMRVLFTTWNGRSVYRDFADLESINLVFLKTDPHNGKRWPPRIWQAIESGVALIGMSEEQINMAKGIPDEVNTSIVGSEVHKQLIYTLDSRRTYIYTVNGTVTAIQN